MNSRAKKKAEEFLNEYRLNQVSLGDLRRIITSQGYTIVEFNHIFNDEHVATLIESLQLDEIVGKTKGFTYADKQRRLVFLHEDLSDNEKLLVLAHEEGHIYCDHFSSVPVIGRDVVEEHEANEFTHYILNRSIAGKVGGFIKERKKLCSTVAIILVIAVIGSLIFKTAQSERSYYGEYYITTSGKKYHEEECIFVKGKTNTHRMTIDEFESGDYEPCGICLPHTNTNTESGE